MGRSLHVLILTGPTREHIDPIRFISNASSGRQGIELAATALARGHDVDLVQGPVCLPPPPGARVHPVTSASEMLERAREIHPRCDVLIAAAAVSDYRPRVRLPAKRKRSGAADEVWSLELIANPDILRELSPAKGERIHVGFALETEEPVARAIGKRRQKGLDWIVANEARAVGDSESARNDYWIIGPGDRVESLGASTKAELARALFDRIEALADSRKGSKNR